MKKQKSISFCIILILLVISTAAYSLTPSEIRTLKSVANVLVDDQYSEDNAPAYLFGSWPFEYHYTGSIVAGLINVYEITPVVSYIEAAERGASFILIESGGNFYGDEAYALARLGEVTGVQDYSDIVRNFYDGLDTYQYISGFNNTTTEKATFYISFHAVASHMVGAADAGIWREAITEYLSNVNDDLSFYPVMTLGVATWALAKTGPMDDTPIDPFGLSGVEYWKDVTLGDLPDLLSTHQVLSGDFTGSFYVRFDHTAPGLDYYASGYTEDTVYGIFGLMAAYEARDSNIDGDVDEDESGGGKWNFFTEIQNARDALIQSVNQDGLVKEHIWYGQQAYYLFGGELLETYSW